MGYGIHFFHDVFFFQRPIFCAKLLTSFNRSGKWVWKISDESPITTMDSTFKIVNIVGKRVVANKHMYCVLKK